MGNNEIKSKEDSEGSNFYLPAAPAEFTAFGPELWIAFYLLFRGNFWRPSSIQIARILAKPEMLPANQELHVAAKVTLFLKGPNLRTNSQRVGKTLHVKVVSQELADTFLAQYDFNSQIAPDVFDLQRMEKKSGEAFRGIEDAIKSKEIVDMPALMALVEQIAKWTLMEKNKGEVQMIAKNNKKRKKTLPYNEGVSKDVCEYHSGARGHWNIAKSSRGVIRRKMAGAKKVDCCMTSHKQHTPKDLSKKVERLEDEFAKMTQYVERLTSLVRAHDSKLVCDFHFGEVGHSVKDCKVLKHRVQNLIDHGILIIDEALNMISTWPPNHHEGMTSMTDTSSMVTSSVRGDLPTSPYPQGLPFPSLLLNRGGSTSFSPQAEGPSEEAEHACHPCEKARSRPDS
uniref:Uncharacterized protein n=1 Tax=Fagus sylvatica TaxID=28930 RepID=A0A2N9IMX6_FAGSY